MTFAEIRDYFQQVCLMSQSWDNVANIKSIILCMSNQECQIVQCTCADVASSLASPIFVQRTCVKQRSGGWGQDYADERSTKLWTYAICYYGVDHTPHCISRAAAWTHCVMATFSLCSNVEFTTKLWQRTDLASRFARGSVVCWAGLLKCVALCAIHSRMHIYGHPRLCTRHYNSDQSWAFWTCRRAHLLCPPG